MTVWTTGAGMEQLVLTGRESESDIDYELLVLVMITTSASVGKDTEAHSAKRKSLLV